MRISGKIILQNVEIFNAKAKDVTIEYDESFNVSEVKDLLNLIDVLPGKVQILKNLFKDLSGEDAETAIKQYKESHDIINDIKESDE